MVNGLKRNGCADSMPVGLGLGAALSLLLTVLSSVVIARLVDTGVIQWEQIGYCIMVQTILASFAGAALAAARIKRQKLLICLLSGGLYFGLLLLITALFFGGQYEGVWATALLVLAGSGSAALIGMREKRGGGFKKRNKRYR